MVKFLLYLRKSKLTFDESLDEVTKTVMRLKFLEDKFTRVKNIIKGWRKLNYSGDSAVSDIDDILIEGENAN